jgi:RNA polymerase sigma factor (sigma-70 family)
MPLSSMSYKPSDDAILQGFREGNADITKRFFYGYCMVAYNLYDRRYGLRHKPGLDFYSLAHEYYISLLKHNWRQLEDRSDRVSLSTWMVHGFLFIIKDAIKAYNRECEAGDIQIETMSGMADEQAGNEEDRLSHILNDICANCYADDERAQTIIRMMMIEGYKGNEVAEKIGISPSAVAQRFRKMKEEVIIPYIKRYCDGKG